MIELSLFSGAGGGLLGSKQLGWRVAGYVEKDEFCQKVIAQRIADGLLDEAPIYGDIRAFNREGYAEAHRGMVDVLTGGFPCQPFSVAGRRKSTEDNRNLWPQTYQCIRLVRPQFVFLENVLGLSLDPYFRRVLGELADYVHDTGGGWVRGCCLPASKVGAPHQRERLWIVAYAEKGGRRLDRLPAIMAHTSKERLQVLRPHRRQKP